MTSSTAIAERDENAMTRLPTDDEAAFGLMQREAKLFANSPLIPDHLRKGGPDQAMANCYIALKMAKTMGEDPLVVLQNIHIVQGKAGFASQYVIARANASGVFEGRINWREEGEGDKLSVTAFAALKDSGEEVSFTCDMAMARAENWTKNPKYKSMPKVMLRYRSAAFLVRFYAPDVMLGYHTTEEWNDLAAAGTMGPPVEVKTQRLSSQMLADQAGETIDQAQDEDDAPTADTSEQDPTPAAKCEPAGDEAQEQVEDQPEQDADTANDGPDPWQAKYDEIVAEIDKCTTVIDLRNLRARVDPDIQAMPDDLAAQIKRQFKTMGDALKGKAQ